MNSGFVLGDDPNAIDSANARIVRIPAGIDTKRQLLATLALGLDFPDYFGWNWDALEECLRDLSWIEWPRRIVLIHEDVPLGDADDQTTYLAILKDALALWGPTQAHELRVHFPSECQAQLQAILHEST